MGKETTVSIKQPYDDHRTQIQYRLTTRSLYPLFLMHPSCGKLHPYEAEDILPRIVQTPTQPTGHSQYRVHVPPISCWLQLDTSLVSECSIGAQHS